MGNALEVIEVMRVLTQGARGRLYDLSIELGARLLVDHGISKTPAEAREKLETLIATGKAAGRFGRMIAAQGGPTAFEESWTHLLPEAPVIKEVTAEYAGYISAWDGIALGLGVVDLGGGRHRQEDVINPAVGLSSIAGVGDYVDGGVPIATIHAARPEDAERMETVLKGAVRISDVKPDLTPLIFEDIR
jgi:thymidine phosphorylase